MAWDWLAAGMDPQKSIIFVQSMVRQVTELHTILSMVTPLGKLTDLPTFKEKVRQNPDNVNYGLVGYPVLMAADILLYQADVVPVGIDQMQHLEITRDLAQRFNGIYGDVFTIPEAYIGKTGAKIMSLQDPVKKMSKSDENPNASIYLMDPPDVIMKKCKRAVTDSENEILYNDSKPGIKNLIDIYSSVTGKTADDVVKEFEGKGYGDFKSAVGESVGDCLKPIQDRCADLAKNKDYIDGIIKNNAEKANYYATKTLRKVQRKVGFPDRIR